MVLKGIRLVIKPLLSPELLLARGRQFPATHSDIAILDRVTAVSTILGLSLASALGCPVNVLTVSGTTPGQLADLADLAEARGCSTNSFVVN